MKGIILAGGSGTRLYPSTKAISKQIIPIYDKPMIYYPLSVLMLAGIKDILIISTPSDLPTFKKLFGNGQNLGLNLEYAVQPCPEGLAQAFIIGETFIGDSDVCLVLGDNIFHIEGLTKMTRLAKQRTSNEKLATVFGCHVKDPERYGVIEFDSNYKALSIEEKPISPKSNFAIVGLYFYPNDVVKKSKTIIPSERGELEISSVNQKYLEESRLYVERFSKNGTWLDTGTVDSLIDASQFVKTVEKRSNKKIACIEEIAFRMGYISIEQLEKIGLEMLNNEYGQYLLKLVKLHK